MISGEKPYITIFKIFKFTQMKSLFHVFVRVLVLVFVFAQVSVLASCSSQADELLIPNSSLLTQITVSFSGFNITTTPMTRAGEDAIPDNINRLALKVFDANGAEAAAIAQKASEPGFGTVSLTLAPGTYTFVCVLNEAAAANADALAAIAPATITSATVATIPGYVARDTYCCSQQVEVTSSTQSVTLNMGSRINARFKLSITDAAPATVASVRITISPDGATYSGNCLGINPTTGRALVNTKYLGEKPVSAGPVTDTQIDLYIPATDAEAPFTTSIRLEGRNAAKATLYTRTLTGVQFSSNSITHATGRLFDPTSASAAFSFGTTDWTTNDITF